MAYRRVANWGGGGEELCRPEANAAIAGHSSTIMYSVAVTRSYLSPCFVHSEYTEYSFCGYRSVRNRRHLFAIVSALRSNLSALRSRCCSGWLGSRRSAAPRRSWPHQTHVAVWRLPAQRSRSGPRLRCCSSRGPPARHQSYSSPRATSQPRIEPSSGSMWAARCS